MLIIQRFETNLHLFCETSVNKRETIGIGHAVYCIQCIHCIYTVIQCRLNCLRPFIA